MNDLIIKICGMREQAELDCAAALGVDLCGFIFAPQSPRAVTPEQAAALDSGDMLRVGVFVTDDMRFIEETARAARLDRIQLHGDQSMTCADRLSRTLGAERLIRVLWPERYPDLAALEETMNRHAASTGMFLLDAGMSGGGSGKRIGSERLRGLNGCWPAGSLLKMSKKPSRPVSLAEWISIPVSNPNPDARTLHVCGPH